MQFSLFQSVRVAKSATLKPPATGDQLTRGWRHRLAGELL
jgi:hypothetical protein